MDRKMIPAGASERLLGLEGAPNFRDIGDYATANGQRVRRGLMFRSGELSKLTPADAGKLDKLRFKSVIDLRTQEERDHEPSVWLQAPRRSTYPRRTASPRTCTTCSWTRERQRAPEMAWSNSMQACRTCTGRNMLKCFTAWLRAAYPCSCTARPARTEPELRWRCYCPRSACRGRP